MGIMLKVKNTPSPVPPLLVDVVAVVFSLTIIIRVHRKVHVIVITFFFAVLRFPFLSFLVVGP